MIGGIDFGSSTWAAIRSWAEQSRDKARRENDTPGLDLGQTEALRGRISALNELIGLPEQSQLVVADDVDYLPARGSRS